MISDALRRLDEETVLEKGECKMMENSGVLGGGMWGMGLIGLLVLVLIVLGIAALVKYLRN